MVLVVVSFRLRREESLGELSSSRPWPSAHPTGPAPGPAPRPAPSAQPPAPAAQGQPAPRPARPDQTQPGRAPSPNARTLCKCAALDASVRYCSVPPRRQAEFSVGKRQNFGASGRPSFPTGEGMVEHLVPQSPLSHSGELRSWDSGRRGRRRGREAVSQPAGPRARGGSAREEGTAAPPPKHKKPLRWLCNRSKVVLRACTPAILGLACALHLHCRHPARSGSAVASLPSLLTYQEGGFRIETRAISHRHAACITSGGAAAAASEPGPAGPETQQGRVRSSRDWDLERGS